MNLRSLSRLSALLSMGLLFVAGCSSTPTAGDTAPVEEPSDDDERVDEEAVDGDDYVVHYRDRSIDLHPYVQGFPYGQYMPDLEHAFMLYFETTPEGKWLRHLKLDEEEEIDLTAGQRVHDIDWSTRSFRYGEYNESLERFLFLGDEQNDEKFNIFSLDLDSGELEASTDVDYIYGFKQSDDHRLMAYVARHGSSEPFNSCLHIRDLESGEDTELWCDDGGEDRLTWTGFDFSPDQDSMIVRMQHDGDRTRTNLARFSVDEPGPPSFLLERGIQHHSLWSIADSYDGDQVLYASSHGGINNIYRYDFASRESTRLSDLELDISAARILEKDGKPPLLAVFLYLPYGTIMELRDPGNGEVLWSEQREESIRIADDHAGRAVLTMSSVQTPFRMELADLRIDDGITLDETDKEDAAVGLTTRYFSSVPDELAEQLTQCDVERIEFATFDEVEGETRKLHAYLYTPREPPEQHLRIARITAFYGGGNGFSVANQIMCEAGITTLSPAVRGSRGFGAEFAALNDGDLGGDDIVDLFYAARWLEVEHGFRHYQIGVHGGSHGGYAAMRALTFPPETNDHDDLYQFGFGFSHAGISDLMHFYETSNIPDWLVLLAGDPQTEPERLRDRSPLYHVERLESPLLLTHGSHDSRVPVDESRRFAEAAQEYGLPVVYEEFEGQGHGIDGLANRMRYYRAIFDFLETSVDPRLQDRADAH